MTKIYEQIFDICYYGGGGFTFKDVMEMPVNVRSFYYSKLAAVKEKENEIYFDLNQLLKLSNYKSY